MFTSNGSLVDFFKRETTAAPTRKLLRSVARREGERMTEVARRATPRRTGETAEAWRELPVVGGLGSATSGTTNPSWKARLLENGWEEHEVTPDDAAAIDTPQGPRANATAPAFGGTHALARAAEAVEIQWAPAAQPDLQRWAREVEQRASRS